MTHRVRDWMFDVIGSRIREQHARLDSPRLISNDDAGGTPITMIFSTAAWHTTRRLNNNDKINNSKTATNTIDCKPCQYGNNDQMTEGVPR